MPNGNANTANLLTKYGEFAHQTRRFYQWVGMLSPYELASSVMPSASYPDTSALFTAAMTCSTSLPVMAWLHGRLSSSRCILSVTGRLMAFHSL